MEIALNEPFDAQEIIEIACDEFRKKLEGLSPLTGGKQYARFTISFVHTLRLCRSGEADKDGKDTIAWGNASRGIPDGVAGDHSLPIEVTEAVSFESDDPNAERQKRKMMLTVESGPEGNKKRRKVRIDA